jgi:hypothetical protein
MCREREPRFAAGRCASKTGRQERFPRCAHNGRACLSTCQSKPESTFAPPKALGSARGVHCLHADFRLLWQSRVGFRLSALSHPASAAALPRPRAEQPAQRAAWKRLDGADPLCRKSATAPPRLRRRRVRRADRALMTVVGQGKIQAFCVLTRCILCSPPASASGAAFRESGCTRPGGQDGSAKEQHSRARSYAAGGKCAPRAGHAIASCGPRGRS